MSEKINPQSLKPAHLMRLLNTVGFGTVLTEHRLRRHRNRAGYAIGTEKTINLFKYAAWLTLGFFREKQAPMDYVEKKRIQTLKNIEAVRAAQDIGELPPVADPHRKAASLHSFRTFCENYFSEVFYLDWSPDHLRVMDKIERAVRYGGLFALAMPRGSGKALALDTPIPTAKDGFVFWKTMDDIEVGDFVLNEDGSPCRVEFATEVMHDHPCYEVGFSDGEKIVCDADHLWYVHNGIHWETRKTESLVNGYVYRLPESYPHRNTRYIKSVKAVESVPVRCIQVDSPSKLYLAGYSFIPTHNTVLCQTAVVWASLSGAAPFVCLIAASADRAQSLLETIKTWLETNFLLQSDFPEVCYPVKCLERIANRQKGQKYLGEPTRIEWSADKVVLPTIAGSNASGVVISCSGMHGSDIRGQQHARPDGRVERPGLVLIDDPQTTESAWSRSQSQRREAILAGDVLGMAGPGKKIAGLMACTVIRPGDMASRILDREKHPDWQGERTKLVYAFPTNEKLWSKYAEMRNDSLRNDGDGSNATEFYRQNQSAMDEGALIAWPQRFNIDELSAVQNAMNLKLRDELAFFAEYQNEPKVEDLGEEMLSVDDIAEKTNGYQRTVIPSSCQHLTFFADVHQNALFWMLTAWESNFSGYIIDYGSWPDQHREYFTLRDCQKTIKHVTGGAGLEAAIYSALTKLGEERLDRVYFRDDGSEMRVERAMVDAGWGQTSDVIYQYCRQSKHSAILFPSHGQYVGASSIPFSEHRKQRGDRIGRHWRIPGATGNRLTRHVLIDTNYWKTFVHARLGILMGDPGCLSLYGHDPKRHRLLAEHLTAEYRVRTMAYSKTVDEWKIRASRPDNHWLDCLVGCAVAASIQGAELSTFQAQMAPKRERIRLSDRQKFRRN